MDEAQAGQPIEVYGFWRSQAMFRLRVALNLKGLAYHEIPVNLEAGGQDTPAFRQISPMGSVPAFMVGAIPLTQSLAILEYLDECHPQPPLLPTDPLGRARVRSLAAIAACDTHPLIVPRVKRYLADQAGFDAVRWRAWQAHFFGAGLHGLEARLANEAATGTFCHGDRLTFADICLAGLHAGATTFAVVPTGIPTVERIVAVCMALPAFDAAQAAKQVDAPA